MTANRFIEPELKAELIMHMEHVHGIASSARKIAPLTWGTMEAPLKALHHAYHHEARELDVWERNGTARWLANYFRTHATYDHTELIRTITRARAKGKLGSQSDERQSDQIPTWSQPESFRQRIAREKMDED